MQNIKLNVLLVEDNMAHIRLTERALEKLNANINLFIVYDGESAISFIEKQKQYSEAPDIDLILLDLNLPGLDGRDFLRFIKQNAKYKDLPIVILTSSTAEADVRQSYANQANAYICKPISAEGFIDAISSIKAFWLETVIYPKA